MSMTWVVLIACVATIICIGLFCEWRVEKALQQVYATQVDMNEIRKYSTNVLHDAQAMYYVLLDIYDDDDVIDEIVDKKKEELAK